MAAKHSRIKTAEYLVDVLQEKGIDINIKDDSGVSIVYIQISLVSLLAK